MTQKAFKPLSFIKIQADAELLLEYAVGNGLLPETGPDKPSITPQLMGAIKIDPSTLTPENVTRFWDAYAHLARLVRPVTAASLIESNKVSLGRMKCGAGILVAAVILASIYLFMSTATLNETTELIARQNTAALKLWADVQTLQTNQTKDQEEASDPSPTNAVNNGRVFEEIIEFSRSTATLLQSASRLHTTLWWIDADVSPPPGFSSAVTVATVNVEPDVITNGSKLEAQAVRQIKLYQSIRNYALHLSKTGTLIYNSLSTYVLPTVYALLGAFLYGFRRLSLMIEHKEYLPSAASGARYFIAAIAGLVVGLFGSLLPPSLVLPPLAIAFLVGYAVDAFFNRLDQVIERLKGEDPDPGLGFAARAHNAPAHPRSA